MEHIVYLSLGSNLGDRAANLKHALASLPPQMEIKARSKVYETPPWGYADQPKFLNRVVKVQTYVEAEPLLKHIKRLEIALGRQETFHYGPRLIDIDILFYDNMVMETPVLILPHPQVHKRGFVLRPMMDIAPDFVHPTLNQSVREMMALCDMDGIEEYVKQGRRQRV